MIFTQDAVAQIKNRDGKNVFSKLGIDMGFMGVVGFGFLGTATAVTPLVAVASIAMLVKLPSIIRGISYVKNDVETFIPEYRLLLKNKYLKNTYENQFKKLAVDYIENSETVLEKRFKAEFLTEWLHSTEVYTFELNKSGFSGYCTNLKNDLIEAGLYKDRTGPSNEIDTGVIFGGYCENDEYAKIQRKVFEDFKDEGMVGSLIIKGGNAQHLDGLLALQDYRLTYADQKIIQEFINLPASNFIEKYKSNDISGSYFTKDSSVLISNNLTSQSRDRLDIAGSLLAVGEKIKSIQNYVKQNSTKLKEPPVSVYSGFFIDMDILSERYKSLLQKPSLKF